MTVETRFAEMGARVRVRPAVNPRTRWTFRGSRVVPARPLPRLDVRSDRKGEYFDLVVPASVEMDVLDTDADGRHLLLLARLGDGQNDKARYLCGHDERHWFVAAIPESYPASTVNEAKIALQPGAVREAAARLPMRKRVARNNDVYRRQGEWFFIPDPEFEPTAHDLLLHNEPLGRNDGRKAHMAEDAIRHGGETRYVAQRASVRWLKDKERAKEIANAVDSRLFTKADYEKVAERFPEVMWATRLVNPTLYVRGAIRHSDHATLVLHGWHRVAMNTESLSRAMSHVAFLD